MESNMNSTDLSMLLQHECQQLETEAVELNELIRQSVARWEVIQERLAHVRALLGEDDPLGRRDNISVIHRAYPRSDGRDVCELAEQILSERDRKPMYYKELASEVQRRGGILNGKTPAATLTARLVGDERFIRPTAKGFYALRKDYPNARNVGARRPHSRRKRRGAA